MPVRLSRRLSLTGCGDGRSGRDHILTRHRFGSLFGRFRKGEALEMNDMFSPNKLFEVTRLTRAGRLTEATALIQRIFRGEIAPDVTVRPAGESPPIRREQSIIDAEAFAIEEMGPPSARV